MTHSPLTILHVCSEMTPFAKAGGLADVVAALAPTQARGGHEVHVVLPAYSGATHGCAVLERRSTCVSMGVGEEWGAFLTLDGGSGVGVHLVEHDCFFGRGGLYHDDEMRDYDDNPRRFGFLCRAALQYCRDSGLSPDVVHAHDWQGALVPYYLRHWFWNDPVLGRAASVLTIHNIAYQGVYPPSNSQYLGIAEDGFREWGFESFGALNLLKGGICFADAVNTVSPGHAREIVQPYQGFGLAPYLAAKGERFTGILNGADYEHWSPESDTFICTGFSRTYLEGKALCKKALQERFGLEPDPRVCLVGMVGRFVEQKGFGLVAQIIDRVLSSMHVQFVVLGSGEREREAFFADFSSRWSGKAGSWIGYSNELAHQIEAGSDFFLMPSLFEPCGLTQMYALRYGTLPIVRATGGLSDTVRQYDESSGEGTGFLFHDPLPDALYYTIGWAVSTWYDRRHHIDAMIQRAMEADFSWEESSRRYDVLYTAALQAKRDYDTSHLV